MQKRIFKNLIAIFFVVCLLSSCKSDVIVPDTKLPADPTESKISFKDAIQPIFTAKCIACHNVGQIAPVLAFGKSYQSLKSISGMINLDEPNNSTLYKKMATGGSMATYCGYYSSKQADADSTLKWIRQGAIDN